MSGHDEFEDDNHYRDVGHDDETMVYPREGWLRDRCVIPGACIVADPFRGPDECHSGEDVEAYEAELGGEG